MFALNLEELDDFHRTIWPLSIWVAKFREIDHMKNGEGLYQKSGMSDQSSETDNKEQKDREDDGSNSIAHRILRLVAEKTRNKFNPKLESYRVMILTHLSTTWLIGRQTRSQQWLVRLATLLGQKCIVMCCILIASIEWKRKHIPTIVENSRKLSIPFPKNSRSLP